MRPADIFDICHRRYVFCKTRMENQAAIINPTASAKHGNKPDNSPKVAEYVADFQLAGEHHLPDEIPSDTMSLMEGYITITALAPDMTDHRKTRELQKKKW